MYPPARRRRRYVRVWGWTASWSSLIDPRCGDLSILWGHLVQGSFDDDP